MQDETDERLICARDVIEQYIMQRIAEFAFKSTVDTEGDELLSKRMKLLSFLKPEVRFLVCVLFLGLIHGKCAIEIIGHSVSANEQSCLYTEP